MLTPQAGGVELLDNMAQLEQLLAATDIDQVAWQVCRTRSVVGHFVLNRPLESPKPGSIDHALVIPAEHQTIPEAERPVWSAHK